MRQYQRNRKRAWLALWLALASFFVGAVWFWAHYLLNPGEIAVPDLEPVFKALVTLYLFWWIMIQAYHYRTNA